MAARNGFVKPVLFRGRPPEMKDTKWTTFQCGECAEYFETTERTTDCPNCGSGEVYAYAVRFDYGDDRPEATCPICHPEAI